MPAPAQPIVVDLLVFAVAKTALREHLSAEEFRAQISDQYEALVSGDRLRLQVMWDLFAPRTGFDPKLAACPMCWLKTLENRLGVLVELPGPLAQLKSSEVATNAAKVFVRREDVDRLLGPDTGVRVRSTTPLLATMGRAAKGTPLPATLEPGAAPLLSQPGAAPLSEPGAAPLVTPLAGVRVTGPQSRPLPPPVGMSAGQRTLITVLAGGLVIAMAIAGVTLRGSCAKAPTAIELNTTHLPVRSGERFGRDASFVLTDPNWLKVPEADRTAQLRSALDALRPGGVDNLAIRDANGALRASAQWTGTEARVRFY